MDNTDVNTGDDMLDSFMSDINATLSKEKLSRKSKLLRELEKEYDRITSLANLAKPALTGLADTTSFTEAQLNSVAQYEQELKRKKQETDNDTRDRAAERQQLVRDQMKQLANTTRAGRSPLKKSELSDVQDKDTISKDPTEDTTEDTSEDTNKDTSKDTSSVPDEDDSANPDTEYVHPLLSGVAKVIEKEKESEKKRKKKRNRKEEKKRYGKEEKR